jgi:uncharacterized protein YxjI
MPSSDQVEHGIADRPRQAFTVPRAPREGTPNYLVRESRIAVGDDYVIEADPGGDLYVVDGQFLRVRESLTIKDTKGAEVFHIQGTLLGVKDVLALSRADVTIATVRKQTSNPPKLGDERYIVELPGAERVEVIGSPADRRYSLNYHGHTVATVSHLRRPLSKGYRVQVAADQDDGVVLGVTVCLDVMSRSR